MLSTNLQWEKTDVWTLSNYQSVLLDMMAACAYMNVQGGKAPQRDTILRVNRWTNGEIWIIKDMKYIQINPAYPNYGVTH
jgi:hypothetical protein